MFKEDTIAKQLYYQINQYIRSKELRVIDEKGKQVGVLTLKKALEQAQTAGLDLVEVSPHAKPPVAKIIDFKKFKYQQSKKMRESAKRSKVETKEIRITPFIAQGDLDTRVGRMRGFLTNGDRVKVVVKFVGRQITRKEFGYDLINKVVKLLEDIALPDGKPKQQGKMLYLIMNPSKKAKKNETKN